MKRTNLSVLALTCIILSLSACSNQAESEIMNESEIKLASIIISSRVTDSNLQSTQIVKGQQTGVTIIGAKNEHKNVAWTAGDDGALINTDKSAYWGDDPITITAYHPYNSEWAETNHIFSVNTDQSIEKNYLNSDLLWSTTTASIIDSPVSLPFRHKLAKINVTIKSNDIKDLSGTAIYICGTNIETGFYPNTGDLSDEATGNVQEIKAGITTSTVHAATAIIIPQKLKSGTKFIKITHEGQNYYYTLPADKEFKSGFSYNYTLNVKETQVELISDNITNWKDENTSGDAEETFSGDIPYLAFMADAEQSLTMSRAVETLEYSVDDEEWATLGTNKVTFGGEKGNLRLRGKSPMGTAEKPTLGAALFGANVIFGNMDVPVACKGDIRTLIDWSNHSAVDTSNARFYCLFRDCKNLTSAPLLPISKLATYCYSYMFENCTSLKAAPKLPALELHNNCYEGMFQGCTSLIDVPELPASKLRYNCYESMFEGCTSITSGPELKSEDISWDCYSRMFKDCINLKTAPELPAKTMQVYCYDGMFQGCTSLTIAPKLPAETLASNCYKSMFEGCINLTTAPELPAKTMDEWCYSNMFKGCKKINKITMLATNVDEHYCLNNWLEGVSSTGTFIKAKEMTTLSEGSSGIPVGWTVKDYTE